MRGTLCLLFVVLASAAGGQPAAPRVSDAVILIAPLGERRLSVPSGQAMVAVTFPKTVAHAAVRSQMASLLAAGGWQAVSLEVKDEEIVTGGGYRARQTGATALIQGGPLWRDGAFVLQPYVDTFRALGRFKIMFLVPPDPAFRGLQVFDDPVLSVRLERAGSPYQYVVEVRNHAAPLPRLPLVQAQAQRPPASGGAATTPAERRFGPVLIAAALGGLLVLAGMLVRIRLRSADAPGKRT